MLWDPHATLAASCRVRHIVYSCVPRPDAKTARLRGAVEAAGGLWRDVLALSEADLAQLVRSDKVDILVDLTGHTANNRLGTFAMRPAPIQVDHLSFAGHARHVVDVLPLACIASHVSWTSPVDQPGCLLEPLSCAHHPFR